MRAGGNRKIKGTLQEKIFFPVILLRRRSRGENHAKEQGKKRGEANHTLVEGEEPEGPGGVLSD